MSNNQNKKLSASLVVGVFLLAGVLGSTSSSQAPPIRIGVVNLAISNFVSRALADKFQKERADFRANQCDLPESGDQEQMFAAESTLIKQYLEKPNELKEIYASYLEYLSPFSEVTLVPIDIDMDDEGLEFLIRNVDAVFLTGGANHFFRKPEDIQLDSAKGGDSDSKAVPTKFTRQIKNIIQKVKQSNDSGFEQIMWGTCLGFEALLVEEASADFRFDHVEDLKQTHSLKIVERVEECECPGDQAQFLLDVGVEQHGSLDQRNRIEISSEETVKTIYKDVNNNDVIQIKTKKDHVVVANSSFSAQNVENYQEQSQTQTVDDTIADLTNSAHYSDDFNLFVNQNLLEHQNDRIFYYNHQNAVTLKTYLDDPKLMDSFRVITVSDLHEFEQGGVPESKDQKSICLESLRSSDSAFISSVQHKKYPFYGVQFHPEKPEFEHDTNIPDSVHSELAVQQGREFAAFFINRVRRAKLRNLVNGKRVQDIPEQYLAKFKFSVKNLAGVDQRYFF